MENDSMIENVKSVFVMKYKNSNDFVALDPSGGGHPFNVPYAHLAKQWDISDKDKIENYFKMFPYLKLVQVQIKETIVSEFELVVEKVSSLKEK